MFWTSSVLIKPGFINAFHMLVGNAVVIGSDVFLSGTGRVNRYGICSDESCKDISTGSGRMLAHRKTRTYVSQKSVEE
jgi:hypothetical protein